MIDTLVSVTIVMVVGWSGSRGGHENANNSFLIRVQLADKDGERKPVLPCSLSELRQDSHTVKLWTLFCI